MTQTLLKRVGSVVKRVKHMKDTIVVLMLLISVYTDLKTRKILNAVVVPGMLAGLIINFALTGTDGLFFSLKGLGLGFGLLIIPFALGGFGAGDVKLLGAIGSLKGSLFVFKVFLATGIAGGVLAILVLIKQKRLIATIKRICSSLYVLVGSVFKVNTLTSLDKAEYHESLPYGLAIGIGTLMAYLVG
jgi:prepilin peptidase CpaA